MRMKTIFPGYSNIRESGRSTLIFAVRLRPAQRTVTEEGPPASRARQQARTVSPEVTRSSTRTTSLSPIRSAERRRKAPVTFPLLLPRSRLDWALVLLLLPSVPRRSVIPVCRDTSPASSPAWSYPLLTSLVQCSGTGTITGSSSSSLRAASAQDISSPSQPAATVPPSNFRNLITARRTSHVKNGE